MPGTLDIPDLQSLFTTTLEPRLAALDRDRLALRKAIVASALLIGLPVVGFCGSDVIAPALPPSASPWIAPVCFVLIIVGLGVAVSKYAAPGLTAYMQYRARFKKEIVGEIFKAILPGATYAPERFVAVSSVQESGLFAEVGRVGGDDLISGTIGGTPFQASEIHRHYKSDSDSPSQTVFHGLFIELDDGRAMRGRVIVQPHKVRDVSLGSRGSLTRVPTGDAEFDRQFDVFAEHESDARAVVTPRVREALGAAASAFDRPLFLSFVNHRAYVAVHFGRALFEPSIRQTTSFSSISEMGEHFHLAKVIVSEVGSEGGPSERPLDVAHVEKTSEVNRAQQVFADKALASGSIAGAVAKMYTEADKGPPPDAPRRPRARFETRGDEVIVRYAVAWWAVMGFVVSVAAAAIALAGAAALVDPAQLRTVLAERAAVVMADDQYEIFVAAAPVALGAGAILGAFFTLYWITYVRTVRIGRDQIRVARGLRPFARRYPRSSQSRILQLDRYVYLGQADTPRLINPSLSPMLRTKDEARWVAWQMRRAFEEIGTSFGA